MTTSWTDNPDTTCTRPDCTEDTCSKWHPDTDIAPERYGFWFKGDKRDSYITAAQFNELMVEINELAPEFNEAVIVDLDTKAKADAAVFAGWWFTAVAA